MATSKRDTLIVGLRNAYGMEAQGIDTLDRTHKDLENYPQLKAAVGQSLEESRRQKDALEGLLSGMGETPSALKEAVMRLAGNVQGLVHMMAGDEVLKNTFTLYAYDHFEMACYRSLIAMAEDQGESKVVEVCRGILKEEEQSAERIGAQIESVTRAYHQREAAGQTSSG